MVDTGASVPDQALVSDQAASRIAPAGFDPSRWIGPKYSPNLNRWLAYNAKRYGANPRVFKDRDGILWIGRIEDGLWFIGTRLMRCLTVGAKARTGAYVDLAPNLSEMPGFWPQYDADGRCAIDKAHCISFIGSETRWKIDGDHRSCIWCGKVSQRLKRWTETVQRTRWENCDSDGNPKGGNEVPSQRDDSAGIEDASPSSDAPPPSEDTE